MAAFENKTAIIFGAGQNIGRAIAREFARRGARVAVADINAAGAEEAAQLIRDAGGEAIGLAGDVMSSESIAAAAAAAERAFGPVDIVMNNAGLLHNGWVEDIPLGEWQRMFDVNLFGMVRSLEVFVPKMIARGAGHIVNTASFAGLYPFAINRIPYAASKAAVVSMSQNLAVHLEPKGIQVSCLCPGPVMTTSPDSMKTFSGEMEMRGPGSHLKVKSQAETARILADGMEAGRILIPTHEELWDTLKQWVAGPDDYIRAKAAAFASGDIGKPSFDASALGGLAVTRRPVATRQAGHEGPMMDLIKIGDAEVRSALEMSLQGRPIAWLGADPQLIEANRDWLAPHFLEEGDTWSLDFRTWILRVEGKVVVVDPCTGNGRPNPLPPFDMLDTPFIERFCATGVRPEDVTHVFCTHMHHDHCGWNTQLRDGRWTPTFPNARYLFLRREYDRWNPNGANYKSVYYNEGVFERSIAPVVEAGLADLVIDRHRLSPQLEIEAAPGHTLGHAILRLTSQQEEAWFTGDCFHHPLQLVDPRLQFGDCDDVEQAIATRRALVVRGLEREALLIPAHLPKPHAGRLRRREGRLVFDALSEV